MTAQQNPPRPAWMQRGPLQILTSAGVGGAMARRLLPLAIGLPLAMGWLCLLGERVGLYGFEFGLALFATINVVTFSILIWLTAVWLHRAEARRKQSEDELKASLKEIDDLKAALDEHAIVAITDPQGKISYVNAKFCAISKYAREELLGQDHRIINSGHHPKEFIRNLWTTIAHGRVWRGEIKNKAKDGSFYWVDTTIVPFLNEQGKPRQYVAIRADITERKQAEAALQRVLEDLEIRVQERTVELQRSNQELEQFANAASHDLQEPLRAVTGCVQILQRRYAGKLDDPADELIQHVVEGTGRMQTLIHDLLAYSHVGTRGQKFEAVDSAQALQRALDNLQTAIRQSGATITRDSLPTVRANPVQLTQLFQNLVGNALKYRGARPPQIQVAARRDGAGWIFSVSDNGIGIEPQYFERIFMIFQRLHTRREYPGTGIGLALCKKIAEHHGGRIWVESGPGQGSVFSFTIPAGDYDSRL